MNPEIAFLRLKTSMPKYGMSPEIAFLGVDFQKENEEQTCKLQNRSPGCRAGRVVSIGRQFAFSFSLL